MRVEDVVITAPFGPLIGTAKLSEKLLEKLNTDFDDRITQNIDDASGGLAGVLATERYASADMSDEFVKEIAPLLKTYIATCVTSNGANYEIRIESMWYNEYSGDDYNPVHTHSYTLSAVWYMNDFEVEERDYRYSRSTVSELTKPGDTVFVAPRGSEINREVFAVSPEKGKVVLFPSSMQHLVYPAKYLTPRRTGSANFSLRLLTEEN